MAPEPCKRRCKKMLPPPQLKAIVGCVFAQKSAISDWFGAVFREGSKGGLQGVRCGGYHLGEVSSRVWSFEGQQPCDILSFSSVIFFARIGSRRF